MTLTPSARLNAEPQNFVLVGGAGKSGGTKIEEMGVVEMAVSSAFHVSSLAQAAETLGTGAGTGLVGARSIIRSVVCAWPSRALGHGSW